MAIRVDELPRNLEGVRSTGWWGMVLFIATEAMFFASLLGSYFFLRFRSPEWPLGGLEPPEILLVSINTVILLSSSGVAHLAERGLVRGDLRRLVLGLAGTVVLGVLFLSLQVIEYLQAHFTPRTNAYGSLFFTITGFHGAHVAVGVVMLAVTAIRAARGAYDEHHHLPVTTSVLYWHFVDVVWIFVFSSLYLLEHL